MASSVQKKDFWCLSVNQNLIESRHNPGCQSQFEPPLSGIEIQEGSSISKAVVGPGSTTLQHPVHYISILVLLFPIIIIIIIIRTIIIITTRHSSYDDISNGKHYAEQCGRSHSPIG